MLYMYTMVTHTSMSYNETFRRHLLVYALHVYCSETFDGYLATVKHSDVTYLLTQMYTAVKRLNIYLQ